MEQTKLGKAAYTHIQTSSAQIEYASSLGNLIDLTKLPTLFDYA